MQCEEVRIRRHATVSPGRFRFKPGGELRPPEEVIGCKFVSSCLESFQ